MEIDRVKIQRKYKVKNLGSAKIFALPGITEGQLITPVMALCEEVYGLEARGDLQEAFDLLEPYWREIERNNTLETFNDLASANLLLRAGSVISALGNARQIRDSQEEARKYLAQADNLFDRIGCAEGRAQCLNKTGVTHWQNGDLETAQIYFRESLAYAETDESKAIADLNIAMIESLSFRHASARRFYEKAYEFIDKVSLFTEAKIRNGLGIVYKDIGNSLSGTDRADYFDKAILEFQGALICYEEIQNDRGAITARNNIGFLYSSIGLYEEAHQALAVAESQAFRTNDKNRLSIVYDTHARIYIAEKKYQSAAETASKAVACLDSLEASNLLVTALITSGIAFARQKETEKSKSVFERAERIAAGIQDFVMVAAVRLFALRENFGEYSLREKLSTYLYAIKNLSESQEKDIRDALNEITRKIEAEVESPVKHTPEPNVFLPPSFSLDGKIKEISRRYIKTAIAEAHGNQSHAAALLGMSRQTLIARIKKEFPDLFDLFNVKINQDQKIKSVDKFTFHYLASSEEKLALSELQEDYKEAEKGDILLVELGSATAGKHVVLRINDHKSLKIGLFGADKDNCYFESSGEKFILDDEEKALIIGTVIGFCRRSEFQKLITEQNRKLFHDIAFEALSI